MNTKPGLNAATLAQIVELEQARDEPARAVSAIDQQLKQLKAAVLEAMGDKTSAKRGDFRATVELKAGSLSYSSLLAARITAEEMAELKAAAPPRRSLIITQV